ncbi:site-specific integrase [Limibaculum sp. M0105]|uniref:Site-specific integrase n=1 Tax=Thermohalobaculum xanthum TaxID=2753746 RepID=A0A8J7M6D4_9RHOB|nr:site-specific integrase [Thermohalobaculum xanthum]MBK0399010.1 site-specific integrase [Thermohalobaculum xanthum]
MRYRQRRLGEVAEGGSQGLDYANALTAARAWFDRPDTRTLAAESYPLGCCRSLKICPAGAIVTVGHALDDYVEWKRLAAARSHFETNLSLINHHIVPRLAEIPLDEFNGLHLRDFARQVLETPPKRGRQEQGAQRGISSLSEDQLRKRKKTLNTLISILRVAFQMAWENGRTDNDRCWRCLRRLPNVDRPRMLFLTRQECRVLLSRCRPDLRRFVLGALYSGCRATELHRLRVADVARHGYGIFVAPVKTYRPRFVFLPDEGMLFFLSLCEGRPSHSLIFVRDDGRPWEPRHNRYLFKRAVRDAGLPAEFVFHGLRHTYASQLVQAGTPLSIVAEQLGHASTSTVSNTYGHLAPQVREAEIRRRFEPIREEEQDSMRSASLKSGTDWSDAPDWRSYARVDDDTSWPKSNFSKAGADALRLLRRGELTRAPGRRGIVDRDE